VIKAPKTFQEQFHDNRSPAFGVGGVRRGSDSRWGRSAAKLFSQASQHEASRRQVRGHGGFVRVEVDLE
jgi:hypothetical protein